MLRQAGVELPYSGDHGDNDDDDSGDKSDVSDNAIAEGVPSPQASTTAANHTLSGAPRDTQTHPEVPTQSHPSGTPRKEPELGSPDPSKKSGKRVKEEPPAPIIETIVKPKPMNISERMSQGRLHLRRS